MKSSMCKAAVLCFLAVLPVSWANAAEISREQAALAAENWLRESPSPMGTGISATQASKVDTVADDDGQPLFHAVRMSGGGTVITSSDTGVEPVIAFGPENMDVTPGSPLHALLMGDMRARKAARGEEVSTTKSGRARLGAATASGDDADGDDGETPEAKWARLLGEGDAARGGRTLRAAAPVQSPTTVTVAPLIGTKWGQGGVLNSPESMYLLNKEKAVAGCSMVVLAQILAYYDPFLVFSQEDQSATYDIKVTMGGNTQTIPVSLQWDSTYFRRMYLPWRIVQSMPDWPASRSGDRWDFGNQMTVGKLLQTCGALMHAEYRIDKGKRGTAQFLTCCPGILKTQFQFRGAEYAGVTPYNEETGVKKIKLSEAISIIGSEIAKSRPVALDIYGAGDSDDELCHSVLADGLGKSGSTSYTHLNMGWNGQEDIWYNIQGTTVNIPTSLGLFNTIRGILYDLRPNEWLSADDLYEQILSAMPSVPNNMLALLRQQAENAYAANEQLYIDSSTPQNAFAEYGFTNRSIMVEWRPFKAGETYTISRKTKATFTSSGTDNVILTTSATGTSFEDKTANPGVLYRYTVKRNGDGEELGCKTDSVIHVLPATGLHQKAASESGITLSWNASDGASCYYIYRAGPFTTQSEAESACNYCELKEVGCTPDNATSIVDKSAGIAGNWFIYGVRAFCPFTGLSEANSMSTCVAQAYVPPATLPAPSLSAIVDQESGEVYLWWTSVEDADYYELYRNGVRMDSLEIGGNQKVNRTVYQDMGSTCIYKVRAVIDWANNVYTDFSNGKMVTIPLPSPTLSLSETTSESSRGVKGTIGGIVDGPQYYVYRQLAGSDDPVLIKTFKGTGSDITFKDWDVIEKLRYYYWVEAVPDVHVSYAYSNVESIRLGEGSTTPTYLVLLDKCGGYGGTKSVVATYGTDLPSIEIPSQANRYFIGYFEERDGVGTQYYYSNGVCSHAWDRASDGMIYAYWADDPPPPPPPPPSALSSISISGPATVASGESAAYTCTAKYSDGSTAVVTPTWSLSSGASYGSISADGTLTANSTTVQRSVTIKAVFQGKSATKAVTIAPEPAPVTLSSLAISGPATVVSAGTATYTCTATYSDKSTETVAAEWSLSAGTAYGSIDSSTGVFTALSAPAQRTVTVKAVFGGKSATKTVTISARTLLSLAISGPDEIPSLETAAYTCTATYGDGTTESIAPTWSIAAGGTYATVVKTTGVVTSKNEGETDQTATLRATSGGKTADKTITLLAKEPPRPSGDLHVDAEKGDDANDGRTWHRAKKTIQGAIDAAVDGELILVFDGVYGPIDTNGKEVEIQSVNGAEATIIDGGATSRCARLLDTDAGFLALDESTVIVGFTLRNGHSADDGGGTIGGRLVECVLCDNETEGIGGGAVCAELERCKVLRNRAAGSGGGTIFCNLTDCLVAGNVSGTTGGGVFGGPGLSVAGCTIVGNEAATQGGGAISCYVTNSIVWGNAAPDYADIYGCDEWRICSSVVDPGRGSVAADPCFADPDNGDYRLRPESPCIDAGDNDAVRSEVDLWGEPRVRNGAVDMGAYECHAPWHVTFDLRGNGKRSNDEISGAPADGDYYVLPDATPTRFGYRFTGWTLADGTAVESLSDLPADMRNMILYADWAAVYYVAFKAAMDEFIDENPDEVFTGDMEPIECVWGEPVALPACGFAREGYAFIGWAELAEKDVAYLNRAVIKDLTRIPGATITLYAHWADVATTTFVDSAGGHVVGYGARVYSSLQAAIDAAPDHGSVIAFPGTYGPIVAEHRKGLSIWAIFGPDTARSEADLSVIDGMGASRCAFFDSFPSSADMSYLVGFHLKEGSADDGGGVRGGFIQNCLITDCHADNMGAGAYGSILYRCRISSCWTDGGGGGAANSEIYESVIDSCTSENYGGGAYYCLLTGSTVYGNFAAAGAGVAGCEVYNSIVWENRHLYETDKKGVPKLINYANVMDGKTVIYKNSFAYSDSSPKPSGKGNLAKDPLFVDADAGDFRLQKSSPVKNKGALAYLYNMPEDFLGLPRTIGTLPDMGANEVVDGTPVPADYDGDGLADPAYYDPVTATLVMMRSRDGFKYVQFGEKNDMPVALYFDDDHRADLAVYSATAKIPTFSVWTGFWWYGPYPLGAKGATPLAADIDGDGLDDLAIFQGNDKKPSFSVMMSSVDDFEDCVYTFAFGTKGAKAVAGDFDGDGLADLGCYTSTASKPVFKVALSGQGWSDKAPLSITLGAKGSEPCCGDFDGDGVTDFAAYSGTAKVPLLYRMFSTSKWREVRTLPFGEKGSRAAIADWDGDGSADPAVEYHGRWWYVTRGWDVGEVPAP